MLHMPPVAAMGSSSSSVTFHASLDPVFWTLKPNCPHCPRVIVAGPDLLNTRLGAATAPIVTETLALAVCGGLFHVATPVLVTIVPAASVLPSLARKRSSFAPPGARGPYAAEWFAVMRLPATLTPVGEPFMVAVPAT